MLFIDVLQLPSEHLTLLMNDLPLQSTVPLSLCNVTIHFLLTHTLSLTSCFKIKVNILSFYFLGAISAIAHPSLSSNLIVPEIECVMMILAQYLTVTLNS